MAVDDCEVKIKEHSSRELLTEELPCTLEGDA